MPIDTVTLEMIGAVSLTEFSATVTRLEKLLDELAGAVAQGASIVWLNSALEAVEAESTLTAYRGTGAADVQVEDVVRAYGNVGMALQAGEPITVSSNVRRAAEGLVSVINGRVTSLRFETPEVDATISIRPADRRRLAEPPIVTPPSAYGAVEGRVQTLSSRGGLRFSLYDTLHDKAVSCYMAEDFDPEAMRGAWGKRAIVAGWVTRDPDTGHPRTIRRVSEVVVLPELGPPDDYRRARGVVSARRLMEAPEATIRRVRDAD
jgi:hypothetical protein